MDDAAVSSDSSPYHRAEQIAICISSVASRRCLRLDASTRFQPIGPVIESCAEITDMIPVKMVSKVKSEEYSRNRSIRSCSLHDRCRECPTPSPRAGDWSIKRERRIHERGFNGGGRRVRSPQMLASITSTTAWPTTLSSSGAISSGSCCPSALGMKARFDGSAGRLLDVVVHVARGDCPRAARRTASTSPHPPQVTHRRAPLSARARRGRRPRRAAYAPRTKLTVLRCAPHRLGVEAEMMCDVRQIFTTLNDMGFIVDMGAPPFARHPALAVKLADIALNDNDRLPRLFRSTSSLFMIINTLRQRWR